MSTPQTASALHHHPWPSQPHHYDDYALPHPHDYRPNGSTQNLPYNGQAIPNQESPVDRYPSTATYATKQPSTNASIAYSAKGSPDMRSKGQRKPDWSEFYKNGVPAEVIVIDDEAPETSNRGSKRSSQYMDQQPTVAGASSTHVDKRRRVDPAAHYQPTQAARPVNRHRPWEEDSDLSNSASSRGRSTAANTYSTGQTSLSSTSSNGYRNANARLEPTQVGQKRKRLRDQSEEEADLKVTAHTHDDLWAPYVPPPRPPIKAKEVKVKEIRERIPAGSAKCDDADGHYMVIEDSDLTERYRIIRLLGQGTFGKVVEAFDRHRQTRCAIKIIRAVSKYRDASRIELRVLQTLSANDKHNRNRCIHLRECFDWRNHICIVTDLLSESVFDFLKRNQFTPFPHTHIQSFAHQLFTSVAFLHDLNLVHTDLKPENILLVSNAYQTFTYDRKIPSSVRAQPKSAKTRRVLFDSEIRLIDFGSATFEDEYHSSVVSTRHYRAPEIILNLGWSYPCDIWSIGCILVEFFTGDALFQTHDNLEHLAMMEAVCSKSIDSHIIEKVRDKSRNNSAASFFRPRALALNYPSKETPKQSRAFVKNIKPLEETIPGQHKFNDLFLDLLKKIFVYDPKKRITAKEALNHPWFREPWRDDGTEAKEIQRRKAQAQAKNGYYR